MRVTFSCLYSHKTLFHWCATVVLLLCIAATLVARTASSPDDNHKSKADSVFTISKDVDEVWLNFTVTDRQGKFIKGLRADNFNLLDNSQPPERIVHFRAQTNAPLRVILLFDLSSSVRYRFGFEQKASMYFLRHVLRPGIDEAAVISFATEVQEVQPMTGDLDKLTSAISNLWPGGYTSLHDAVAEAPQVLRSTASPNDARKVIIILSDGADTASHLDQEACIKASIESEATILIVDASVPSEHNSPGQMFLKRMAETSGGLLLSARLESEIKGAFAAVEGVLRNQYAISYKPKDFRRDGRYRTIRLTALQPGRTVHARTGYYATPQSNQ